MTFQSVFGAIDFTTLNWDLFVLFIFIAGTGAYMFRFGKDKAFIMLLSSYISFALVSRIDLWESVLNISAGDSFFDALLVFIVFTAAVFFILTHSSFTSIFDRGSRKVWFDTLVIGFLQIGLFISMAISFLSPLENSSLSIFLKSVFVEDGSQFFWFTAPLLAIFLLKRK